MNTSNENILSVLQGQEYNNNAQMREFMVNHVFDYSLVFHEQGPDQLDVLTSRLNKLECNTFDQYFQVRSDLTQLIGDWEQHRKDKIICERDCKTVKSMLKRGRKINMKLNRENDLYEIDMIPETYEYVTDRESQIRQYKSFIQQMDSKISDSNVVCEYTHTQLRELNTATVRKILNNPFEGIVNEYITFTKVLVFKPSSDENDLPPTVLKAVLSLITIQKLVAVTNLT